MDDGAVDDGKATTAPTATSSIACDFGDLHPGTAPGEGASASPMGRLVAAQVTAKKLMRPGNTSVVQGTREEAERAGAATAVTLLEDALAFDGVQDSEGLAAQVRGSHAEGNVACNVAAAAVGSDNVDNADNAGEVAQGVPPGKRRRIEKPDIFFERVDVLNWLTDAGEGG